MRIRDDTMVDPNDEEVWFQVRLKFQSISLCIVIMSTYLSVALRSFISYKS